MKDEKKNLEDAIDGLPEQMKIVLSLYYSDGLNLKDIGRVLDVTESRVSQVHREALNILRKKIIR